MECLGLCSTQKQLAEAMGSCLDLAWATSPSQSPMHFSPLQSACVSESRVSAGECRKGHSNPIGLKITINYRKFS
jgi:hypothetical protein